MKNEEIIIEGLKENLHLEPMGKERVRVCSYVHKKDFPKVASAILSKLQTLKWDNIEKIILEHTIIKEIELKEGIKIAYRVIGPKGFGNIITEILALAPEEGEVLAEGYVTQEQLNGFKKSVKTKPDDTVFHDGSEYFYSHNQHIKIIREDE